MLVLNANAMASTGIRVLKVRLFFYVFEFVFFGFVQVLMVVLELLDFISDIRFLVEIGCNSVSFVFYYFDLCDVVF